ncbi:hypothetical protein, partial [Lentzea kentuckyensis]|uniref:hypothetical protein n=1 Tax=Lentzea kentuckyensis TaxID=360086 RepID=UPI001B8006CF
MKTSGAGGDSDRMNTGMLCGGALTTATPAAPVSSSRHCRVSRLSWPRTGSWDRKTLFPRLNA